MEFHQALLKNYIQLEEKARGFLERSQAYLAKHEDTSKTIQAVDKQAEGLLADHER